MRVLLAIVASTGMKHLPNLLPGHLPYIEYWANFCQQYQKILSSANIDPYFVICHQYNDMYIEDIKTLLKTFPYTITDSQDAMYHCEVWARVGDALSFGLCVDYALQNQYDWIIRYDYDAFPSIETILANKNAFSQYPEINFWTPLNMRSPVTISANQQIFPSEPNDCLFLPWGHPPPSPGVQIISTQLLIEAMQIYDALIDTPKGYSRFSTHLLTLSQIGQLLENQTVISNECPVIDGPIASDMWSCLVKAGMKSGGIAGANNASFEVLTNTNRLALLIHNHFSSIPSCLENLCDQQNLAPLIIQTKSIAPFWHWGNAWQTNFHLDTSLSITVGNVIITGKEHYIPSFFSSGVFQGNALRFEIYKYLIDHHAPYCETRFCLKNLLLNTFTNIHNAVGFNLSSWTSFQEKVISICQQSTLEKTHACVK